MTEAEIQSLILRVISSKWSDVTLYTIREAASREASERLNDSQIMEGVWSLVAQNHLYIDYTQQSPTYWKLCLTARGRAAASDEDINPDNPTGYIRYLCDEIPDLNETVKAMCTKRCMPTTTNYVVLQRSCSASRQKPLCWKWRLRLAVHYRAAKHNSIGKPLMLAGQATSQSSRLFARN